MRIYSAGNAGCRAPTAYGCLQAVAHERPAVKCAAMSALGSLSESVYSSLSLTQQRQVWHCIQSCGADSASAVQAAALKALGTLAMCPSSQTFPGKPCHVALQRQRSRLVFTFLSHEAEACYLCMQQSAFPLGLQSHMHLNGDSCVNNIMEAAPEAQAFHCSAHTAGLPAMVQLIQEGLTCPAVSVQVAAAWALANAGDAVADASCCPGYIIASIAQGASAHAAHAWSWMLEAWLLHYRMQLCTVSRQQVSVSHNTHACV